MTLIKRVLWVVIIGFASFLISEKVFSDIDTGKAVNCYENQVSAVVPLSRLKPTQPNIGLGQVKKKVKDMEKGKTKIDPNGASDDGDPVPVVVGPGGQLFVSDHHHFSSALARAEGYGLKTKVKIRIIGNEFCQKCNTSSEKCMNDFWIDMTKNHLAYLCNKEDRPMYYKDLPDSFDPESKDKKLENDPFRSLVNQMRKDEYKDTQKPCFVRPEGDSAVFFWEFRQAEKIRRQLLKTKEGKNIYKEITSKYKKEKNLPQYIVDQACKAWNIDNQDKNQPMSCADRIAKNPELVTTRSSGAIIRIKNKKNASSLDGSSSY